MPDEKRNDGYLSAQEFASELGVSYSAVRQWIHRGQLSVEKTDDGRILVPKDAVISYKRPWMTQKRKLGRRANPVQI